LDREKFASSGVGNHFKRLGKGKATSPPRKVKVHFEENIFFLSTFSGKNIFSKNLACPRWL